MIPVKILIVFLKTAFSGFQIVGKSETQKLKIKKRWAEMVLRSFGMELVAVGTPPATGASVLVGNHVSYLDIPVLMAALPETTFIAKSDLLTWPIIGAAAAAAGTIFVKRANGSDRALARTQISEQLRKQNQKIVIFPSGTTSLHENKPWKKGAFEIAKETEVPLYLFRIDYLPLRPAAYIDEDQLLSQMKNLIGHSQKKVTLQWLGEFADVQDPAVFAEKLRSKVQVMA
jgi:1-acyl-sn-glycerol-3-phosphate acyltransferase